MGLLDVLKGSARVDDPGRLVHEAARHGLSGVVQHALQARGVELPGAHQDELRRQTMFAAAVGMKVKRLLFRALDALDAVKVEPILLKGYGLACRLYPDPYSRATSDVDLLVAARHVEPAVTALKTLGLSAKEDSDGYYPPQYRHHFALGGAEGLVELHFRPMTAYGVAWDGEDALARARVDHLEGRVVRYLAPEDELVYLSLHAANHMLTRLAWLYDLKLLIEKHPRLDWERVVDAARATAMPALMFYALDAARRAVGAQPPAHVLACLEPSRLRRLAAAQVFSEERLVAGWVNDHKLAWAAAKLVLADSRRSVALFTLRRVGWEARRRLKRGGWSRS